MLCVQNYNVLIYNTVLSVLVFTCFVIVIDEKIRRYSFDLRKFYCNIFVIDCAMGWVFLISCVYIIYIYKYLKF